MSIPGKCLLVFTVLHEGWEMDNEGRVLEHEGERFIVLTSHGREYKATTREVEEKAAQYRNVLAQTEAALALLNPPLPARVVSEEPKP